jgi:hypothetical protein
MKKLRIVTLGIRVGDSRGRFATPADFPLQDCSPYRGSTYEAKVCALSLVQGPCSVAPCQTISSDSHLSHRCMTRAAGTLEEVVKKNNVKFLKQLLSGQMLAELTYSRVLADMISQYSEKKL